MRTISVLDKFKICFNKSKIHFYNFCDTIENSSRKKLLNLQCEDKLPDGALSIA